MTTPEDVTGDPSVATQAASHKSRPEPERAGAQRAAPKASPDREEEAAKLNESVARVVAKAYTVITDNLEQGRVAAARFREGDYPASEVPDTVEKMVSNLISLARELGTATLDVAEVLLKKSGAAQTTADETGKLPSFRPETAAPGRGGPHLPLTVRFAGARAARAHTAALSRPRHPTQAADITAAPLAARAGPAEPIQVSFSTDVSVEGLIVTVTVPDDQPPGFYSGLVYAKDDEAPLGVLTIEVPA